MEKRIGGALILIERPASVPQLNQILSDHGGIILARQGLPLTDRGLRIISLVLEGTNDRIGSLAGKVGRLPGVTIKTLLSATKEARHGSPPSRPSDRNPDEPPSTEGRPSADDPQSTDTHPSTEGRPSTDAPPSSDTHSSTEGPGKSETWPVQRGLGLSGLTIPSRELPRTKSGRAGDNPADGSGLPGIGSESGR